MVYEKLVHVRISVTVILGDKWLTFYIEEGTEYHETVEYLRELLTAEIAVNRFGLPEIQPCMLISILVQAMIWNTFWETSMYLEKTVYHISYEK